MSRFGEKSRSMGDHGRFDSHYQLDRIESRRDMEAIGRNIGETKKNLAQRRVKQGRCPACGTKTHKVGFFGKKTALTVEGQALYGRCLICEPVEGYVKRPHNERPNIEVDDYDSHRILAPGTELFVSDDSTLISGITMEPGLIAGARNWSGSGHMSEDNLARWEEEDDDMEEKTHIRPEPSLASFDNDRPAAPRRRRSSDLRPLTRVEEASARKERTVEEFEIGNNSSRPGQRTSDPQRPRKHRGAEEEEVLLPEQIFAAQIASKQRSSPHPLTPPRSLTPQNDKDSSSSPKPSTPDSRQLSKNHEVEFSLDLHSYERTDMEHRKSFSEEAKNEIEPPFQLQAPQWQNNDAVFASNSKDSTSPWRDHESRFTSHSRDSSEFRREQIENTHLAMHASVNDVVYMDSHHSRSVNNRHRNLMSDANLSFSPGTSPVMIKANPKDANSPMKTIYSEAANGYATGPSSYGVSTNARLIDDSPGDPPLVRQRGQPDEDITSAPISSRPGQRKNDFADRKQAVDQLSLSPLISKKPVAMVMQVESPGASAKPPKIDDIPTILHCLNLDQATARMREKAFSSLAQLVWSSGDKAKSIIAQYKGVETLVRSMWAEIDDVLVQESAAHYLFALAASTDGKSNSDVLAGGCAEGAVDALLISMQSHISVEAIQRDGCGTLCCLASASSNNKRVDDGTTSGGLMIVLQAMDAHRTSRVLQLWGVRALFAQCVFSVNAESNKRSLVRSDFERSILFRALEICKSEATAAEWVCRLFWCLTSNEEVSGILSESPALLYLILDILQSYHRKAHAAGLTEAAYGIISNLSLEEKMQRDVLALGISSAVIESMQYHRNKEGLNVEACALLANLAFDPSSKEAVVRSGGVGVIVGAMMSFRGKTDLIEEGFRALASLLIGSDDARAGFTSAETLVAILRAAEDHIESAALQEYMCTFVATLSFRNTFSHIVFSCGGPNTLVKAMKAHPSERKLQEAACTAFRNIACNEEETVDLLRGEIVYALTKAMSLHEDSETVQRNVCCALWNIVFKATEEPESIMKCDGMNHMVKGMLSHLESGELQKMACGAIWSLIDESDDRKKCVFGNGGVEAVTCALVMHPDEENTIEMACGVLSNLSVIAPIAQGIAEAQGISGVVEAMRNHTSSVSVLEYGSLTLRNIVEADPDCADEAAPAISIIINGMKNNPDAVDFQREACYALWVMAAQSDTCRSRILALDGIAALIGTLEHNNCVADLQEAARGAFKQVTSSAVL